MVGVKGVGDGEGQGGRNGRIGGGGVKEVGLVG